MASLIVALISGCSTVYINHDYDPKVDFSNYKTYAWLPSPSEAQVNPLVIKKIKFAVEKELASKGMKGVSNNADILIASHIGIEKQIEVVNWGYAYGRYGRGWGGGTEVYQYEEGTLVLDLIDAGTKELIWRGTATTVVEPYLESEKRQEKINKAVKELFEHFPPK